MSEDRVKQFIGQRNKVIMEIQNRLSEIASLAENATLILSKKEFKSIDLSVIETIVRLVDFKFNAIYSNTDFIEVVTVDTKLWKDVKERVIDSMRQLIENIGKTFAKLDATFRVPEILHEKERSTVTDLKGQLRDLFTDLLKKIRELGKYMPTCMSEEEISERLKMIYG